MTSPSHGEDRRFNSDRAHMEAPLYVGLYNTNLNWDATATEMVQLRII
jgi:hypothetical protein